MHSLSGICKDVPIGSKHKKNGGLTMHLLLKITLWLLGAIIVLAAAPYVYTVLSMTQLDRLEQEALGGLYLDTQQGRLSYSREGDENAPAVILVHGFSTPKFVWNQVKPELVDAGFQVITFDHLGRGFSDRPQVPYDSNLYRQELLDVIQGLELKTPVSLVGYSMGGANVIDFAAQYPDQVRQLVLIAPAGYMGNSSSLSTLVKPALGDYIATVFGKEYAVKSIREEVNSGAAPAEMLPLFEQQASYQGYTNALLSTLRHYPMGAMSERYQIVGKTNIPVHAIWGTADQVVPYCGLAEMAEDVPQLTSTTLDDGNHNITYARADEVTNAILSALINKPQTEAPLSSS
jgi:pimeloyl-ACP methyl ester carboxylesterase